MLKLLPVRLVSVQSTTPTHNTMKTLKYWVCRHKISKCYSIRAKTKKEAKARREAEGEDNYDAPFIVTIRYKDSFDLVTQCLGEGSIFEG